MTAFLEPVTPQLFSIVIQHHLLTTSTSSLTLSHVTLIDDVIDDITCRDLVWSRHHVTSIDDCLPSMLHRSVAIREGIIFFINGASRRRFRLLPSHSGLPTPPTPRVKHSGAAMIVKE